MLNKFDSFHKKPFRYFSLALFLTFLSFLFLYLLLQKPIIIESKKEIENLKNNQIVLLNGKITKEKTYGNLKVLTMEEIELVCYSCPPENYINRNVSVTGLVSIYNGKKEIRVLSIKSTD